MRILLVVLMLMAAAPAGSALTASVGAELVSADRKPSKKTASVTFIVSMHCKNCVRKISENISFEKGVEDLAVSLDEKQVTIKYNPSKTNEQKLADAIRRLGYEVSKTDK